FGARFADRVIVIQKTNDRRNFLSYPGGHRLAVAFSAQLLVTVVALSGLASAASPPPAAASAGSPAAAAALFVGSAACAGCHAQEYRAWQGSHHQRAMQKADEKTVLGNFKGTRFSYAGIASTFSERGGQFYVGTDGPDGKLHDYSVP